MDEFLKQIEKNISGISEDFASGNVDKYFFIAGNWQEAEALRKRYGVTVHVDLMANLVR